jgi:hypothetical protein
VDTNVANGVDVGKSVQLGDLAGVIFVRGGEVARSAVGVDDHQKV